MSVGTSFDALSDTIAGLETGAGEVRSVEIASTDDDATEATLTAFVPVESIPEGPLDLSGATATSDGGLRLDLSAPRLAAGEAVAEGAAVRSAVVEDGGVVVTIETTVRPGGGDSTDARDADSANVRNLGPADGDGSTAAADESPAPTDAADESPTGGHGEPDGSGAAEEGLEPGARSDGSGGEDPADDGDDFGVVRDDSVPLYDDTEYIGALYEACDTFTEMSRQVDIDVSSETVRRYAIDAGIHEPTRYDTGSGSDSEAEHDSGEESEGGQEREVGSSGEGSTARADDPVAALPEEKLVAGGVGMPSGIDIEDVVEAVADSRVFFEVQQRLELDRSETRELLDQLDLLDLVLHRVADHHEKDASYEEVAARIRRAAPAKAR